MRAKLAIALALAIVLVIATIAWVRSMTSVPHEGSEERRVEANHGTRGAEAVLITPEVPAEVRQSAVPPQSPPLPRAKVTSPAARAQTTDATLVVRCIAKGAGSPLVGMQVTVEADDSANAASPRVIIEGTTTGTSDPGMVEFNIHPEIALVVRARSERGEAKPTSTEVPALQALERREIRIEMDVDDDIHFQGLVLAADTRSPIERANVFVALDDKPDYDFNLAKSKGTLRTPAVITDARGRFELNSASWRHPRLRIESTGYASAYLAPHSGHEKETATILLERGADLDVLVADAKGSPLADITVLLHADNRRLSESRGTLVLSSVQSDATWSATTDAQGRCQLHGLAASAPLFVVLMKDQKIARQDFPSLTLNGGEVRSVTWTIGGVCTVVGVVLDDANARIAHRNVRLEHAYRPTPTYFTRDGNTSIRKATTNADGEFSFSGVEPGQWWIGIAPQLDGHDLVPMAQVCDVPDGAKRVDVTVVAHRGGYIRGQVMRPDDQPAKEATVWLTGDQAQDGTRIVTYVFTDLSGKFALGPLPSGQFQLTAEAQYDDVPSEAVIARDGTDNVVIKLPAGARLDGQVIDAATHEGRRAELVLSARGPAIANKIQATEEDGSFSLGGIQSGTYDLIARIEEGRIAVMRAVTLGDGERREKIVLALQAGARLTVRYKGAADGCSFRMFSGDAIVGADELPKGEAGVRVVPAGRIRVELSFGPDAKRMSRELDVTAGEEKEITFGDDG